MALAFLYYLTWGYQFLQTNKKLNNGQCLCVLIHGTVSRNHKPPTITSSFLPYLLPSSLLQWTRRQPDENFFILGLPHHHLKILYRTWRQKQNDKLQDLMSTQNNLLRIIVLSLKFIDMITNYWDTMRTKSVVNQYITH